MEGMAHPLCSDGNRLHRLEPGSKPELDMIIGGKRIMMLMMMMMMMCVCACVDIKPCMFLCVLQPTVQNAPFHRGEGKMMMMILMCVC